MGHQPRPATAPAFLRIRLRHLARLCYPHLTLRRAARRPIALLSILFVLSIIATGVYLVIPLTLLPALPASPFPTILWLLLFLWSISCTLVSFLLTALAHPGRIPETWRPTLWQKEDPLKPGVPLLPHPLKGQGQSTEPDPKPDLHPLPHAPKPSLYPVAPSVVHQAGTAMMRTDGRHRFCVHCNLFKPDRAHHCSTCRECVLQMDHHCPFTGNSCVGFLNRKFFVLFLYYATLSCLLVATLTPRAILNRLFQLEARPNTANLIWVVMIMVGYILCTLHALALAPFSAFHTYLVLKNRSTIENEELRPPMQNDVLRRSDRGWLGNWKATFGPRPLLWFVPVSFGKDLDPTQVAPSRPPDELV